LASPVFLAVFSDFVLGITCRRPTADAAACLKAAQNRAPPLCRAGGICLNAVDF
jgi:hypothetical protein